MKNETLILIADTLGFIFLLAVITASLWLRPIGKESLPILSSLGHQQPTTNIERK